MKSFLLFLLILCPLAAQPNSGSGLIDFDSGIVDNKYAQTVGLGRLLLSNYKFAWQITRAANGDKTFNFIAYKCIYSLTVWVQNDFYSWPLPFPICTQLSQSSAEDIGPVQAGLLDFSFLAPEAPHHIVYGPFAKPFSPRLAAQIPVTPPDPQMIMLDGFSNNLVEFDVTTFALTSQVTLPPQPRVYSIRPSDTGPENEVWTAHAGTVDEISICDLGAQSVLATIPTPSLVPGNTVPVGIVFTNSGNTALYAVSYYTPDSMGNQGALLVFDAASQTLTSTLLLKDAPTTIVMAPDGLTAYLLSSNGNITYYDVLSGTADLTASTYTPGMSGGYPGAGSPVFIHPDGTRLFWNVGYLLSVFDLTTRKVTNSFNSGLPSTSGVSIQMSQDGSTVWFANGLGNVIILDTRNGTVLSTYQTSPESQVFPAPAY
jgi:hypothetical protein